MAPTLLIFKINKAPSLLILLLSLLFIQNGLAQPFFGNSFGGQFSGEGFLNNQGQPPGLFQHFPFLPFQTPVPSDKDSGFLYNHRHGRPEDDEPKAAPGASTPADDSDRNAQFDEKATPDLPTNFKGKWAIVSMNAGVSAMHIILFPNNKVIMYDASAFRISNIKLPNGECVPFKDKATNKEFQDCWSHGVEFDVKGGKIRPLKMLYDPWCSSGGLAVDGTLVGTGGWDDGVKTVRYLKPCDNCDFKEYQTALGDPRWYATQITLPEGGFLVVGGRRAYSYEYVPQPGKSNTKANFLSMLDETTDLDENNLYPFVHLSTDGNVFIFANNRSVLVNLDTNEVVRELPALPGGARNYPASGMSALLPIRLDLPNAKNGLVPAEVIVCGGNTHEAYAQAGKGTFAPALQDCNRLTITDPNAVWKTENMPSRRVMGDMIILPNGDLLLVNGAKRGTAAWWFAEDPNFVPVLYRPDYPVGTRFEELEKTNIPRMYHSTAQLLPDGRVLIAGSNTNPGYNYTAKYPTELRVEAFTPPYLAPNLTKRRPAIMPAAEAAAELTYKEKFEILFELKGPRASTAEIKVTMYPPPFTTHGYSMNQRLVVLDKDEVVRVSKGQYKVMAAAPPSAVLAPPGYYLLFVVYRGVPSEGIWVRIK